MDIRMGKNELEIIYAAIMVDVDDTTSELIELRGKIKGLIQLADSIPDTNNPIGTSAARSGDFI